MVRALATLAGTVTKLDLTSATQLEDLGLFRGFRSKDFAGDTAVDLAVAVAAMARAGQSGWLARGK